MKGAGSQLFWGIVALAITIAWAIVGTQFYFPCLCGRPRHPILQCVICLGFPLLAAGCCKTGLSRPCRSQWHLRLLYATLGIDVLATLLNLGILLFVSAWVIRVGTLIAICVAATVVFVLRRSRHRSRATETIA